MVPDFQLGKLTLELVLAGEGSRVEVVDLADRGEGDEADQDRDGVSQRAQEDDAEDFAADTSK